ncbi:MULTISPECIES: cytochrome c(L), periplasmic [Rhodomicrobium]|uniref:cytochrome c(L), periplasmic n=1 Tax=Rhodomicrobium TaxID=1068 RepID=UPI001FD8EB41|nr:MULTISPECIES: cytochrome c(L), periplasmic [Rhodomicrobium]
MKRAVIAVSLLAMSSISALAQESIFRNTVTGEVLDFSYALPEGRDTEGVKQFMATGVNPYTEKRECMAKGEEIYLTACSGCHGHHAEGKLGPGLADNYWTYPKNVTDKGLFETIYGGAQAQMGPQYSSLTLDEMLHVIAWVRHIYAGPVADAEWLSEEQKRAFKPYNPDAVQPASAQAEPKPCSVPPK